MIYLLIIAVLILLVYRYDILGRQKKRDFWYRFMLIVFVLLAGFRWRVGGDTQNYLFDFYYYTPTLDNLSLSDIVVVGQEPFYLFLNSFVKSLGGRFFIVQLIQAAIVNVLMFRFFKKYKSCAFTCILFYFVWLYVFLCFEEMRAAISVVICLKANDYALKRFWGKAFSLYVLASMFHFTALLMILVPLFMHLKFNRTGMFFLVLAVPVSFLIQSKLGDYLFLFDASEMVADKMYDNLGTEEYMTIDLNFNGIVGLKSQYFLYSVLAYFCIMRVLKDSRENSIEAMNLYDMQGLVIIGLAFVVISTFIPIAIRYVRFFQPYFVLYFSYLFSKMYCRRLSLSLNISRQVVLLIPFFFLLYKTYFSEPSSKQLVPMEAYYKYVPYSSIFDRNIGVVRERNFDQHPADYSQY